MPYRNNFRQGRFILPHDSRKSQDITVRKTRQSIYLQEPMAVTPYIAVDQEEALVPESWARLYPSKLLFLKPWPIS